MTDLRPTSAQDDLRATLTDAGRVDPEVERLRAENERLLVALEELVSCIDDGCFCSEMRMASAMDAAEKTLKGQTND